MRLLFSSLLFLSTFYLGPVITPKPAALSSVTDSAKRKIKVEPAFPTPSNVNKLFYLQRTANSNTLIYDLNTDKNGQLDAENPVKVYWIRYAENGQQEELNYIQRKFAYGVTSKAANNNNSYDIRFVSYKKFPLSLMKSTDGKYHIFATIADKQAILNRIFVKIEGGSFWLPNVVYVELKGTDPATGKEIMERFKP